MRRLLLGLVFIFLLATVFASCNETQININSASAEELDNLTGIGPAYALKIIEMRPFNSVDDLINVSGIGEKKLADIKKQGLACVNEDEIKTSDEENYSVKEIEKNTTKVNEITDVKPEKLV